MIGLADRITIRGLSVSASHGVLDAERSSRQPFLVDLDVYLDLSTAGASDSLRDTLDYADLAARAHDLVATESHNLIERVAAGLAEMVLANQRVERVVVTVHKPEAPVTVDFDDIAVRIDRRR